MLRRNLTLVERLGRAAGRCAARAVGSPLWLQIKADVLQKPVTRLENEETALLGAAVLGAVATGAFSSPEAAVRRMVRVGETFEPEPANAEVYDQAYDRYVELYERLKPMFR
jgi:xylulokinase